MSTASLVASADRFAHQAAAAAINTLAPAMKSDVDAARKPTGRTPEVSLPDLPRRDAVAGMIERHYGALVDGAGADFAGSAGRASMCQSQRMGRLDRKSVV